MKNSIEYIDWGRDCHSECCDAPLLNFENDLGICSDCKEWAGPIDDEEDEE